MGKLLMVLGLAQATVAYILLGMVNKEESFWLWPTASQTLLWTYVVPNFLLGCVAEFISRQRRKKGKSEKEILSVVCDFEEYEGKKIIDLFLAHYGKVGIIGFFFGLMIYSFRPLVAIFYPPIWAILIPVMIVLISLVYGFCFCKFWYGLRHLFSRRFVLFIVPTFVLAIDLVGLTFFVESVPKVLEKTECTCDQGGASLPRG
jgi:hypothetical protein